MEPAPHPDPFQHCHQNFHKQPRHPRHSTPPPLPAAWEEGSKIKLFLCTFPKFSLDAFTAEEGSDPVMSQLTIDLESGATTRERCRDAPPACRSEQRRGRPFAEHGMRSGQPGGPSKRVPRLHTSSPSQWVLPHCRSATDG